MNKKILLTVISLAALMLAVPTISSDGTDEANYNFFVEGYVAEGGGDTGKIPMAGVIVSIKDQNGNLTSAETNAQGYFKVGIFSNTNLTISFITFGYTIITCPNTTKQSDPDYLILTLSNNIYNNSTRTYTITSTVDDMQCAIMTTSDGTVKGVVSYDRGNVKNASVILTPINGGESYTTNTDDRGTYEINCPTGEYVLKATCKGFNDSEGVSVSITSSPSPSYAYVTLEKSEPKKYLGLDFAHVLMLIGVIVGILLAVFAWFLSQRKGPKIVDDSVEEDEDIRYP